MSYESMTLEPSSADGSKVTSMSSSNDIASIKESLSMLHETQSLILSANQRMTSSLSAVSLDCQKLSLAVSTLNLKIDKLSGGGTLSTPSVLPHHNKLTSSPSSMRLVGNVEPLPPLTNVPIATLARGHQSMYMKPSLTISSDASKDLTVKPVDTVHQTLHDTLSEKTSLSPKHNSPQRIVGYMTPKKERPMSPTRPEPPQEKWNPVEMLSSNEPPEEEIDGAYAKFLAVTDAAYKRFKRTSRIIVPDHVSTIGEGEQSITFNTTSKDEIPRFVLLPDRFWRVVWETLLLFVLLYHALTVPFAIAFDDWGFNDMLLVETLCQCVLFIDIVLHILTAYRPKDGPNAGVLVHQYRAIWKNYARSYLAPDLIAAIPIDWLFYSLLHSSCRLCRLVLMTKFLRLMRLKRILIRMQEASGIDPAILRLVRLLLYMLSIWHNIGCFYWFIVVNEGFTGPWSPDAQYQYASLSIRYCQAVYWAVAVTTGVGRDVDPHTEIETAFTVLSIVVGVAMYAVIIGSASSAIADLDQVELERRHHIDAIMNYMKQRDVPTWLRTKVREYYEYMFTVHHGSDKDALLTDLHSTLKQQLTIACNSRTLSRVNMFRNVSEDCHLALISKLKPRIYLPSEYVVLMGDRGREMFFVIRGKCEVLNHVGVRVRVMSDGDFFGEVAIFQPETRRTMSIRSVVHSELMVLDKADVYSLMRRFPQLGIAMHQCKKSGKLKGWALVRYIFALARASARYDSQETFPALVAWMGSLREPSSLTVKHKNQHRVSIGKPNRVTPAPPHSPPIDPRLLVHSPEKSPSTRSPIRTRQSVFSYDYEAGPTRSPSGTRSPNRIGNSPSPNPAIGNSHSQHRLQLTLTPEAGLHYGSRRSSLNYSISMPPPNEAGAAAPGEDHPGGAAASHANTSNSAATSRSTSPSQRSRAATTAANKNDDDDDEENSSNTRAGSSTSNNNITNNNASNSTTRVGSSASSNNIANNNASNSTTAAATTNTNGNHDNRLTVGINDGNIAGQSSPLLPAASLHLSVPVRASYHPPSPT